MTLIVRRYTNVNTMSPHVRSLRHRFTMVGYARKAVITIAIQLRYVYDPIRPRTMYRVVNMYLCVLYFLLTLLYNCETPNQLSDVNKTFLSRPRPFMQRQMV